MGLKWPISLIGPLDLVGKWFGEDQRANIIKTHVLKRLNCIFKNYDCSRFNSEHDWEDRCI